jgi:serine/threonine protein kinase
VLVFDGPSSTAESWIAKLTDFGHSTLGLDGDGEDERLYQAMVGTRFFSPPELDGGPTALSKEKFERIDIWCWGMLVWRVMIEGTEYLDSDGQKIENRMIMLRKKPTFSKMASQSCRQYLSSFHEHERPLVHHICEILRRTLDYDPLSRPSSRDLLAEIEEFSGERYEITYQFSLEPLLLRFLEYPLISLLLT